MYYFMMVIGEMVERFKAPVLKTGVVIPPRVRIPLSPKLHTMLNNSESIVLNVLNLIKQRFKCHFI